MNALSRISVVISVAMVLASDRAQAQFEELVGKVPSAANAVVFLNSEKVMASPVARKQDWQSQRNKAYAAGLTFLPPDTKAAVLSTELDLDAAQPKWSIAAMSLDHEPSLATIERLTGGTAEKIGKYSAVELPGRGYVVQFGPRVLGAIAPATRQVVARWVRDVDSTSEHRLSPYLAEAMGFATQVGTPVIMAIDLQDVASGDDIRQALAESAKYKDSPAARLDELSRVLASIRGVTLGITLETDEPFGKIKVDFREPVSFSAEEGKELLLHALAERGAMLDELEEWKPNVAGRQITLEGFLTASGMKRLASLFDRPPAFQKDVPPPPAPAAAQTSSSQSMHIAESSRAYFERVVDLLDDLKKTKKGARTYTMGQIAVWCESFARKIDQLPSAGVDPQMVNYGAYVADSLRAASSAIKTSNARKRVRQVNTPMQYDTYTYANTYGVSIWGGVAGNWGTVTVPDYRAYQQARTAISAEERVTGATQARDIISRIDEATGDIRRQMAAKYNMNF